jgi:hypothetical protein
MQSPVRWVKAIRHLVNCPRVVVAGIVIWAGCMAPSQKGGSVAKPQFEAPGPAAAGQEEAAVSYPRQEQPSPAHTVQQKHAPRLMAIDGVLGVGVGLSPVGDEAIVVYLRDQGVAKNVPRELDGIPVQVQVTGPIDALKR